jgi:hypothetical protein
VGFRIHRPTDTREFRSWADYLDHRTTSGLDGDLCRVIEENVAGPRSRLTSDAAILSVENQIDVWEAKGKDASKLRDELSELKSKHHRSLLRAATPWITPVLGSGCLSIDDSHGTPPIALVPARLRQASRSWEMLPDNELPSTLVETFATGLLRQRFPGREPVAIAEEESQPAGHGAPDASLVLTARVTLCAALMARFFHRASDLVDGPLPSGSAPVILNDAAYGADVLRSDVVAPLRRALSDLRSDLGPGRNRAFLRSFARQLEEDLSDGQGGPRVRRADVVLMTEIAWHLMTRGTTEYAGWRNLLLGMGLEAGAPHEDARMPVITNLDSLQDWLVEGLKATTEESGKTRASSEGATVRDQFYYTVAELISQQARLDREHHADAAEGDAYPLGVAFVTSFDIELEMALVELGKPFVMVVPFEFVAGAGDTDPRGTLVWLYTVVVPPAEPTSFSAPILQEQTWSYLAADTFERAASPAFGLPVVVRLTGSPLVAAPKYDDLPAPSSSLASALRFARGFSRRVMNAVLVDEYAGLHHWSADLIAYQDEQARLRALGLPKELIATRYFSEGDPGQMGSGPAHDTAGEADDTEGAAPTGMTAAGPPSEVRGESNLDSRFWLLLGVQIGDVAIRHRVASLVAASSLRNGLGGFNEPARAGVAINRRSEPRDRDVFHWQGLDTVHADCGELLSDLKHNVRHLRAPENRFVNGRCGLPLMPRQEDS